MQVRQHVSQIVLGFHGSNAVQLRLKRSNTLALNGGFIHARGIEVADLLLFRTAVWPVYSRFIQNVAENKTVALGQLRIAPIAGLIARHGVLLEPSTTGVL